jgi:hypothetical protein
VQNFSADHSVPGGNTALAVAVQTQLIVTGVLCIFVTFFEVSSLFTARTLYHAIAANAVSNLSSFAVGKQHGVDVLSSSLLHGDEFLQRKLHRSKYDKYKILWALTCALYNIYLNGTYATLSTFVNNSSTDDTSYAVNSLWIFLGNNFDERYIFADPYLVVTSYFCAFVLGPALFVYAWSTFVKAPFRHLLGILVSAFQIWVNIILFTVEANKSFVDYQVEAAAFAILFIIWAVFGIFVPCITFYYEFRSANRSATNADNQKLLSHINRKDRLRYNRDLQNGINPDSGHGNNNNNAYPYGPSSALTRRPCSINNNKNANNMSNYDILSAIDEGDSDEGYSSEEEEAFRVQQLQRPGINISLQTPRAYRYSNHNNNSNCSTPHHEQKSSSLCDQNSDCADAPTSPSDNNNNNYNNNNKLLHKKVLSALTHSHSSSTAMATSDKRLKALTSNNNQKNDTNTNTSSSSHYLSSLPQSLDIDMLCDDTKTCNYYKSPKKHPNSHLNDNNDEDGGNSSDDDDDDDDSQFEIDKSIYRNNNIMNNNNYNSNAASSSSSSSRANTGMHTSTARRTQLVGQVSQSGAEAAAATAAGSSVKVNKNSYGNGSSGDGSSYGETKEEEDLSGGGRYTLNYQNNNNLQRTLVVRGEGHTEGGTGVLHNSHSSLNMQSHLPSDHSLHGSSDEDEEGEGVPGPAVTLSSGQPPRVITGAGGEQLTRGRLNHSTLLLLNQQQQQQRAAADVSKMNNSQKYIPPAAPTAGVGGGGSVSDDLTSVYSFQTALETTSARYDQPPPQQSVAESAGQQQQAVKPSGSKILFSLGMVSSKLASTLKQRSPPTAGATTTSATTTTTAVAAIVTTTTLTGGGGGGDDNKKTIKKRSKSVTLLPGSVSPANTHKSSSDLYILGGEHMTAAAASAARLTTSDAYPAAGVTRDDYSFSYDLQDQQAGGSIRHSSYGETRHRRRHVDNSNNDNNNFADHRRNVAVSADAAGGGGPSRSPPQPATGMTSTAAATDKNRRRVNSLVMIV